MAQVWRRWRNLLSNPAAARRSNHPLKAYLKFEPLEDRLVPAFASPPDKLFLAADTLAVATPRLDTDGLADLAVLGRTGTLTTALNSGLNTWLPTTINLGEPNPAGFAFGSLDRADPFTDIVVQTPDGILVGTGAGNGRFGDWRRINLGPTGVFSAGAGVRVEPAVGFLAGDTFADIVTVAPGTNEVVVLKSDGSGGFAPAVRFGSGAVAPVSVLVGQFVGDAAPDLAVGHRDGTVTFFRGNADGTFTARPALSVTGLGVITGLSSADIDGDGELDIAVSGTDRAAWLKNAHDPAPLPAIVNGDFAQGLTGWTRTSGTVAAGGGYAEFREDRTALLSTIRQTFTVPAGAQHLTFDLAAYGIENPAGGVPDAFEASLLGPDNRPLVPAFRPGASSFFNAGPNHTVGLGSGATFDGRVVSLDLTGVPAGTHATLVFHLAGSPAGVTSVVGIDNVALDPAVQFDDHFTAVPLAGPFAAAGGVAVGDVDGNGTIDILVADGTRADLFNGTGGGAFTRSEYSTTAWGTNLSAVAIGPMTAGDAVADAALGVSTGAVTPLSVGTALDQAPRLQTIAPLSGSEGTPVALAATFTDPDGGGPYTATIDWGDGTAATVVTAGFAGGTGAVSAAHTYADNGRYPVRVIVRSANGGPADLQDTTAAIGNALPAVTPLAVGVRVGEDAELTVATFTDAGFSLPDFRTRETFLAKINWGDATPTPFGRLVVNNGAAGTPTSGTVFGSHRYATPSTYTGSVTVTDDDGGTRTVPLTITVTIDGPVIGTAAVTAGNEGSAVGFSAAFTDPTVGDAHTAVVAWGDGTSGPGAVAYTGGGTWAATASHVYADNGTYPVTVTVTDRAGHAGSRTTPAVIANVAPIVSPSGNQVLPVNRSVTLPLGTFGDPGFTFPTAGTQETFTATVNWNDGTGPQPATVTVTPGSPGVPSTGSVSGTHAYASVGTYVVTVTVADDDTGSTSKTLTLQVTSTPPTVTGTPNISGNEGQSLAFSAAFTDPDPNGPYTASVNWGDGSTTSGNTSFANGSGTVGGAHTYADNGSYPITLTLTNRFAASAVSHATATVSNTSPTLTPAGNQTATAGQVLALTAASFTDPGFTFAAAGTQETFTATVNWGDGTGTHTESR